MQPIDLSGDVAVIATRSGTGRQQQENRSQELKLETNKVVSECATVSVIKGTVLTILVFVRDTRKQTVTGSDRSRNCTFGNAGTVWLSGGGPEAK